MRKLLILLVLPLAACVDTSSPKFQQATAQKCESYGFKAGSEQMANCRMNLAMLQEQDNMRRKQNMARAVSESVDEFNASQQRQLDRNAYILAHQQPAIPAYRPPINCVSQRNFGGTVTTSCQ